jgi:tripartite-type tricarboxylate transporter receptor subunit TctC
VNQPRRQFLRLAAGVAVLPALSGFAWGQAYPSRAVRLVVGGVAGSPPDMFARLIGQWLAERLGQPFVIDNRPGAGGNLAMEAVARSAPDGHTLLLVPTSAAINATLYDKLGFNFVRDVAPIASLVQVPAAVVVHSSFPARTVPELIAYAKAHPNKVNMASAGNGTVSHVAGELFKMMTGVEMVHVPYRSTPPALTDLIGGQVQVMFDNISASTEHIRAGRLRALAVTTAAPAEALPGVPTVASFIPGFEASIWFGIGAPVNTPTDIVGRLNAEINAGLANPQVRARVTDLGATVLAKSPADFGRLIIDETEKWGKVVKFAGMKPV